MSTWQNSKLQDIKEDFMNYSQIVMKEDTHIYFGLSSTSIPQPGHGYIDGFLEYSLMYNYELKRAWVSDKSWISVTFLDYLLLDLTLPRK